MRSCASEPNIPLCIDVVQKDSKIIGHVWRARLHCGE
jgi:hypothetical protein